MFPALCRASGLPEPTAEFQFAPPRRWRFDWAFVDQKLAIEIQGGIFTVGRHTRGPALLKEYEKLNQACVLGWRILFVTPKQFASGDAILLAKQTL